MYNLRRRRVSPPAESEGPRPDMKDPNRAAIAALSVSIAWLILAQLACVWCWETGLLTRKAALVHWLLVGVLPPALALWSMERSSRTT